MAALLERDQTETLDSRNRVLTHRDRPEGLAVAVDPPVEVEPRPPEVRWLCLRVFLKELPESVIGDHL